MFLFKDNDTNKSQSDIGVLFDGNEKDIDNMSMERLTPAIQRARLILLIRDVTKKGEEIPEELQSEYAKFLQEEGLPEGDLVEEINKTRTDLKY